MTERKLKEDYETGGITLVLGAGVSKSIGCPLWTELVERLWSKLETGGPVPPSSLPPQLVLEYLQLRFKERGEGYVNSLRAALYRDAVAPSAESLQDCKGTLACVAKLLDAELKAGARRRITRVISFNIDDMLEAALGALNPGRSPPAFKIVSRPSHHPMHGTGEQALPNYHVHGFLPREPAPWFTQADDTLVFTDAEYWETAASPLSFANRTMAFALHDSHCVFIGLSMTDTALLRWLATHASEVEADRGRLWSKKVPPPARGDVDKSVRQALDMHYWVRPASDDPSGVLSHVLAARGVRSVEIDDWRNDSFSMLLQNATCFRRAE
jgi:hypothetical protein